MAVANVETVAGRNHAGGTTTAANITVAADALIICTVCLFDGGAGNPLCSAVAGSGAGVLTFQQDIVQPATGTTSFDGRIYKFSSGAVPAGTYTITATHSLNALCVIYLEEVSGAALTSWADGAGASARASSTNPASGDFTASVTDGYWSAGFCQESSGTDATIAAGSGWTMDTTNGRTTTGGDVLSGVEYRANPSDDGPFNGQFTAATAQWFAVVVVYKAASAAAVNIAVPVGSEPMTGRTPGLGFGINMPDVP